MSKRSKQIKAFERLLDIMDDLRVKCPWDKKQTLESLRHLTIEETYELSEAIIDQDLNEIKNELGDLFLHLVFYSKIADEKNAFDVADVLNGVCEKLIHRHPHIYGDVKVTSEEDVKRNWEKLKLKEGKKSIFEGVPNGLPALVKAYRIQEKAKGVGFDFENKKQTWDKVEEEIQEFLVEKDAEKRAMELGDVFFALINHARFENINPEDALEKTNKKFIKRFQQMEKLAKERNLIFSELSLEEMDSLWNEIKIKD